MRSPAAGIGDTDAGGRPRDADASPGCRCCDDIGPRVPNPCSGGATAKDSLAIGTGAEVPTIDPRHATGIEGIQVTQHVHDSLVWVENGEVKPRLATRWEVSEDGKAWTFHLRRGVKFHDGTPFDAHAVKAYVDATVGPGSPASRVKSYIGMLKAAEVVDTHTVRLLTDVPFGQFLWALASYPGGIPSPAALKKWDKQYGFNPAGTGPYKLKEWVRGNRLVLERNEEWWGPKPKIRTIVYQPMREDSSRLVAMEAGQLDIAFRIPPHEVARLQRRSDVQVVRVNTPRVVGYPFNMKRAPTTDVRVRQAINYAVDKDTIIEKFLLGGGRPAVAPIGSGLAGWTNARYYKYDPDQARRLIREAGAEGATIRIRAVKGRYVMGSEIAEAVAEMLKKVGLQPALEIAGDWPAYVSAMEKREHHMALLGWAPASGVTDAALTPLYLCDQKFFNWGDYCNPQVDGLVLKARGTIDTAGQNALYGQVLKQLMDDAAWLYLYYEDVHLAFKKGVKGYYVSPDSGVYLWNASTE